MLGPRGSQIVVIPATPHRISRYLARSSSQSRATALVSALAGEGGAAISCGSLQDSRWLAGATHQPNGVRRATNAAAVMGITVLRQIGTHTARHVAVAPFPRAAP